MNRENSPKFFHRASLNDNDQFADSGLPFFCNVLMNRRDGGRYNLGKEVVVKTGDGDVIRNPQTLLLEKYPVWKKEGCIPGARAYDRQDGQRLHRQDFCGLQDFPRIYAKERKLRPYEAFAVLVKPQK